MCDGRAPLLIGFIERAAPEFHGVLENGSESQNRHALRSRIEGHCEGVAAHNTETSWSITVSWPLSYFTAGRRGTHLMAAHKYVRRCCRSVIAPANNADFFLRWKKKQTLMVTSQRIALIVKLSCFFICFTCCASAVSAQLTGFSSS